MKLKSLLFGSAAALMAVTGAQAAEPLEPIAEPVDYVRICDAFGTGFFYIPGTDTCLKIGGYVRADFLYTHDFEDAVMPSSQVGEQDVLLRDVPVVFLDEGESVFGFDDSDPIVLVRPREDRNYNEFGTRARARLNFDSRVQTDIGMIRTYIDLWITFGPLNGRSFDAVEDPSLGGNFPRQAFIQIANDWGTLTFGKADSFFEFWESDAFGTRGEWEDSPLSPRNLAAATFNLGGGVSATLALEDAASNGNQRLGDAGPNFFPVDLNFDGVPDALGTCAPDDPLIGGRLSNFGFGGVCPGDPDRLHGGNRAPDVVANLRVDQAWGSAQIMGALHPIRARAFTGPTAFPDSEPDTEFGWAAGAGAGFDIPGTGVTFNIQGVYADGAPGYATDRGQVGALSDAFVVRTFDTSLVGGFPSPTFGTIVATDIETVEAWSVKAGIGGDLAPNWVFNLQGSYAEVDNPESLGGPVGVDAEGNVRFANGPAAVQSRVFHAASGGVPRHFDAGPVISGDFNVWTASGWIGWVPVAGFFTGLEIGYEKHEFDAGPSTDRWGGIFRVQKDF